MSNNDEAPPLRHFRMAAETGELGTAPAPQYGPQLPTDAAVGGMVCGWAVSIPAQDSAAHWYVRGRDAAAFYRLCDAQAVYPDALYERGGLRNCARCDGLVATMTGLKAPKRPAP